MSTIFSRILYIFKKYIFLVYIYLLILHKFDTPMPNKFVVDSSYFKIICIYNYVKLDTLVISTPVLDI